MFKVIEKIYSKINLLIDFNFNKKVKNVMNVGIKVSFVVVLFATLIMAMYLTTNPSYILYNLGITLFKAFTMFAVMFFIDGIAFNTILKEKDY